MEPTTADEYFADSPLGRDVHDRVTSILATWPDVTTRTTKSQVAFRRKRAFAFLWRPQLYLRSPVAAEVVLSVALPRRIDSDRFKVIVEPAPGRFMHHLEIRSVADLDDDVARWLDAAAAAAGAPPAAPGPRG